MKFIDIRSSQSSVGLNDVRSLMIYKNIKKYSDLNGGIGNLLGRVIALEGVV